jgi:hypothetical protein
MVSSSEALLDLLRHFLAESAALSVIAPASRLISPVISQQKPTPSGAAAKAG